MSTNRESVRWLATAVAIAALLSLLLFIAVPGQGLWHDVLLNAVHGPIFAVVAVLLLRVRRPDARKRGTAYLVAFALALGLGIVIEVVQSLFGRPGSVFDVLTDAAGAAAGLAAWWLVERRTSPSLQPQGGAAAGWPIAIALAGVTFIAWPPLQAARAYAHRAAVFPSIAEFRAPRDLNFVTADGAAVELTALPAPWGQGADDRALRLAYDATHAPALQVVEPRPDWRRYSVLAVDLTNPGDRDLELVLRILDATHDWSHEDRLNLPLTIPPQSRTTLRVSLAVVEAAPEGRAMDLSRIANVMLFGRVAAPPGELFVSRIWLE